MLFLPVVSWKSRLRLKSERQASGKVKTKRHHPNRKLYDRIFNISRIHSIAHERVLDFAEIMRKALRHIPRPYMAGLMYLQSTTNLVKGCPCDACQCRDKCAKYELACREYAKYCDPKLIVDLKHKKK